MRNLIKREVLFFLLLVVVVSTIFSPLHVAAGSAHYQHTYADGNWFTGEYEVLYRPSFSVTYEAEVFNKDTKMFQKDGERLLPGTHLEFRPKLGGISWFATGNTNDSPFGSWVPLAAGPQSGAEMCNAQNRIEGSIRGGSGAINIGGTVFAAFHVNPPEIAMVHNDNGLTCSDSLKRECIVNEKFSGNLDGSFYFRTTYGHFYEAFHYNYESGPFANNCVQFGIFRYQQNLLSTLSGAIDEKFYPSLYMEGVFDNRERVDSDPKCMGRKCTTNADVPEQSIPYHFVVLDPNNPPLAPTITEPVGISATTHLVNTTYTFNAVTTDPDGDTIRYGFDWDRDGVVDVITPASGYVPGGTPQSATTKWSNLGAHTFEVKAQDSKGSWGPSSSYTVTLVANQPPTIPTIATCPTLHVQSGSQTFTFTATDPERNRLRYLAFWSPGADTFDTIPSSGYLTSGTPQTVAHSFTGAGEHSFIVRAEDERGGRSDPAQCIFTIDNAPPSPPVFEQCPLENRSQLGEIAQVTSTDPDGDQLRYKFFYYREGVLMPNYLPYPDGYLPRNDGSPQSRYVPSGTQETAVIGTDPSRHSVQVLAEDSHGLQSGRASCPLGPITTDPVLYVNPFTIDYGTLAVGQRLTKPFVIKNNCATCGNLSWTATIVSGPYMFEPSETSGGTVSGDKKTVTGTSAGGASPAILSVGPSTVGPTRSAPGEIRVTSNAPTDGTKTVALSLCIVQNPGDPCPVSSGPLVVHTLPATTNQPTAARAWGQATLFGNVNVPSTDTTVEQWFRYWTPTAWAQRGTSFSSTDHAFETQRKKERDTDGKFNHSLILLTENGLYHFQAAAKRGSNPEILAPEILEFTIGDASPNLCPNIPGSTSIPSDRTQATPTSACLCKSGTHESTPPGGACIAPPTDFCSNIPGSTVFPPGYLQDPLTKSCSCPLHFHALTLGGVCVADSAGASTQDIGLRYTDGSRIYAIAVDAPGVPPTSPLRITKGGRIYSVPLVTLSDANATGMRISVGGGVRALKKYTSGIAMTPGQTAGLSENLGLVQVISGFLSQIFTLFPLR